MSSPVATAVGIALRLCTTSQTIVCNETVTAATSNQTHSELRHIPPKCPIIIMHWHGDWQCNDAEIRRTGIPPLWGKAQGGNVWARGSALKRRGTIEQTCEA